MLVRAILHLYDVPTICQLSISGSLRICIKMPKIPTGTTVKFQFFFASEKNRGVFPKN